MPNKHTGSLLVEIQLVVSCPYLSDLHSFCHLLSKQMAEKIEAIPTDRYSLDEWNSALSYITKQVYSCKSIDDVKKKIIQG